jgi:hypothetical protein
MCLFAKISLNSDVRGIIGSFLIRHKTPEPPKKVIKKIKKVVKKNPPLELTAEEIANIEFEIEEYERSLEIEDIDREPYDIWEAECVAEIEFEFEQWERYWEEDYPLAEREYNAMGYRMEETPDIEWEIDGEVLDAEDDEVEYSRAYIVQQTPSKVYLSNAPGIPRKVIKKINRSCPLTAEEIAEIESEIEEAEHRREMEDIDQELEDDSIWAERAEAEAIAEIDNKVMDFQELLEAYEYDIISEIEYTDRWGYDDRAIWEAEWIAELEYEIENSQECTS